MGIIMVWEWVLLGGKEERGGIFLRLEKVEFKRKY